MNLWKKIVFVSGFSGVIFLGPVTPSFAETPTVVKGGEKIVEVGNKFCPVSGDEVSGKHFVIYQGKRYGLCCPMCEEKFKKNPEKYIAKMKQQEAAVGR